MSAATHDVCLGHSGLIAGLARRAHGTVVSNLDLVSMCPAVPNLVPSWICVAPVGGANTGFRHGAGAVGAGEAGTPVAHIHAMESWMSAIALVSNALVATRFLIVVFF